MGTSALFIASKYEEVYPPEISEFVYITDDSFTIDQVLNMEKDILNVCWMRKNNVLIFFLWSQGLSFDISVPTSNYFLDIFVCQIGVDRKVYYLAKVSLQFILEKN